MAKDIGSVLCSVNLVVAVGSVDGVLTAAAVKSVQEHFYSWNGMGECAEVIFTQAFEVGKLDPTMWEKGRKVLFVDLAVNNREPSMTQDFVRRVLDAGHTIVGICDEHDSNAWKSCCVEAGLDFDTLTIKPVTRSQEIGSSGAHLLHYLGKEANEHTRELCLDADAADRMDFSGRFASVVNQATKSAIADNSRRVHLVKLFTCGVEPDVTALHWCWEYEQLLAANAEVFAVREDLGNGIVRVDGQGKRIDVTTLMSDLYRVARVVVVVGEVFNPATKTKSVMHAFGVASGDILRVIKAAGINAGGFAQKANVLPEDADVALTAVRAWINVQA